MAIRLNLDVMMAKRKMNLTELSNAVGITMANMSILKTGKAKAIRFSTPQQVRSAFLPARRHLEYVRDDKNSLLDT